MKTLGKLKLNQFSNAELQRKMMNELRGGCDCRNACACICLAVFENSSNVGNSEYSKNPVYVLQY